MNSISGPFSFHMEKDTHKASSNKKRDKSREGGARKERAQLSHFRERFWAAEPTRPGLGTRSQSGKEGTEKEGERPQAKPASHHSSV